MTRRQPYPPPLSPIPEDPLLGNPCDPCDPRSPMNPLTGIRATHRITLGYRHSSPDGDSPPFRITATYPVLHQSILNSSFSILNWSYTFSAKEKDSETGLSYFGSRYYSSDLSVWLSVDPMSGKYPSLSPYVYCADNPVKLTDPDGRWIPGLDEDNNIIVTREDGDDINSFKKFMGSAYSEDEINNMYGQMSQDGSINLTKTYGREFQIMTDAINDAKKDPFFTQTKNYNCWGASLALMRGDRLYGKGTDLFLPWSQDGVGIDSPCLFDLALNNYVSIKQESASVGKTIMRFGSPIFGATTHASIFLGVDNSGNEYTFSKNGWYARPVVYNSSLLGYGAVFGRTPQEPGYYVKK